MVSDATPPPPGLCEHCRYASRITNTRGSTFYLCERSKTDPAYARYPRLPILVCPGYTGHDDPPSPKRSKPVA
jgi:hypothetical protein